MLVSTGDASFSHVKESNEDNVYVLNFSSSNEKHFVSLLVGGIEAREGGEREMEAQAEGLSSILLLSVFAWLGISSGSKLPMLLTLFRLSTCEFASALRSRFAFELMS